MSQASIFEMAIKYRLGKLFADKHFKQLLNQHIRLFDIKLLSIEKKHNENIINLPMILNSKGKPHADPFDLQIISQAQIEKLTVITLDPYFVLYPINVIE
jgi:PIN domain nuclease of toxin-antitoxin system